MKHPVYLLRPETAKLAKNIQARRRKSRNVIGLDKRLQLEFCKLYDMVIRDVTEPPEPSEAGLKRGNFFYMEA